LHDELGLFEYVGVDALQNEFVFCVVFQCNDIGVVDVAVAKFFDFDNVPAWFELFRNVVKIFQRYASCFVIRLL
jgi:hypothetical protein